MEKKQLAVEAREQVGIHRHRIARIDRKPHALGAEQPEQGEKGDGAVGSQDADMRAFGVSLAADRCGNPVRSGVRLGVGGFRVTLVKVDERGLRRVVLRPVVEIIDDAHGGLPCQAFVTSTSPKFCSWPRISRWPTAWHADTKPAASCRPPIRKFAVAACTTPVSR